MSFLPGNRHHEARRMNEYWVVIPAFNEGATIRDVAIRARRYCRNVIVVDDESVDGTTDALLGLDLTVLRNDRHLGKAGSLWKGFQLALTQGAAGVITLDADGQHAPEEIPSFLAASMQYPHVLIIGVRRREQRKASNWRYLANRIADFWISWAAGRPIEDSQSGFRLYPARLLETLTVRYGLKESFVFESEVLIEAVRRGVRCLHIPIEVSPRLDPRHSHFRPLVDIVRITRMIALKLLTRGLYPQGFYRAFMRRRYRKVMAEQTVVKPETGIAERTRQESEMVSCAGKAQEMPS